MNINKLESMCAEKALKNQIKSENSDKVHQNQGFFKAYKSSAVGGTNEIDENRSQFKAGNLIYTVLNFDEKSKK